MVNSNILKTIFYSCASLPLLSCVSTPDASMGVSQRPPLAQLYKLEKAPVIGQTAARQDIQLGGFSALRFVKSEGSLLHFQTITDRGPNAEQTKNSSGESVRPFLLPDYAPQIVDFTIDTKEDRFEVQSHKPLLDTKGMALSGVPPQAPAAKKNPKDKKLEVAGDVFGKVLSPKTGGVDSEGFCSFGSGYLVSEEYGPDLLQFNAELKQTHRWSPGQGLPEDFALRKTNRGLEALACDSTWAYLMLQSPFKSGKTIDEGFIRLVQFNPQSGKTEKEYFYPVEANGADKIGDMALLRDQTFLVIEQDGKMGDAGIRRVYKVDLRAADAQNRLKKIWVADLNAARLDFAEKIEGIAVIDDQTLALIIDNDFGLEGSIDFKTGQVQFKKDPLSYVSILRFYEPL